MNNISNIKIESIKTFVGDQKEFVGDVGLSWELSKDVEH